MPAENTMRSVSRKIVVAEVHPITVLLTDADGLGALGQVHADAQLLDTGLEGQAALGIQLHRHQSGGEFHHVGFQAQGLEGVGRFQAQQTATDHHAPTGIAGGGADRVQVLQGAIDQARIAFGTFNRWHERVGTGGEHQLVVVKAIMGGHHLMRVTVDFQYRHTQVQRDAGGLVQRRFAKGQGLGIAAREVLGQVHTVVGTHRLFAEHMHTVMIEGTALDQLLDAVMADHAIADHDQRLQLVQRSNVGIHKKSTRQKPITILKAKKTPETLRFQASLPVLCGISPATAP
nr:hypothetical protein GCM10020185_74740 [Pseudomonas brassicacearum subsp. brassicacearum]